MHDLLPEHILSADSFDNINFSDFYNRIKSMKMNLNQGNLNTAINTIITLIEKIYIENPDIINIDLFVERSPEFSINKKYLAYIKPIQKEHNQSSFSVKKYTNILEKEVNQIADSGYQGYTEYFKDMFFTAEFKSLTDRNDRFKIYEKICDKSKMNVLKSLVNNWKNDDYTPMPVSHFGSLPLSLFFSDFNEKENFKKHISDICEQEYQLINLLWENLAFNVFSFANQHQSENVLLTKIVDKSNNNETFFCLKDNENPDKEQIFTLRLPESIFRFQENIFKTSELGCFNVFRDSFIDFINTKHMISNSHNLQAHLTEGIGLMISQYEQKILSDILIEKNSSVKNTHRI